MSFRVNIRFLAGALALCIAQIAHARGSDLHPHLEDAFQKQLWNEVVQTSVEILRQNPGSAKARLRGAFALIQKGYPNAALSLLKRMSPADWKSIPADMKQIVEIVALFQKKVPLISLPARMDQLNEAESSPFLVDEIRFAKGRAAFERGELDNAKSLLNQVSKGSRYYGPACYLLGIVSIQKGDLSDSALCFSRTFEPQILQQSAEFWKDLGTRGTTQFGTALDVLMDTNAISKAATVGELAVLAIARVQYARKDYSGAVAQYNKIAKTSPFFSQARFETLWAMLQLERHDEAQKAAADLSVDESHFESLEARPVRALILTDAHKPLEGRAEINRFLEAHAKSKDALLRYRQFPNPQTLPTYIRGDLKDDKRIEAIEQYQASLRTEIAALRNEDRMLFSAYYSMAAELEPLVSQAREYTNRLIVEQVDRRLKDLDRLYVQARLILAETYLEERELLRAEFRGKGVTEEIQDTHDRQLVRMLLQAVKEVDEARSKMKVRNLSLELRQSELLWELSSASAFLTKDAEGTTGKEAYEAYRMQAIAIAKDLVENQKKFDKRPQAIFFLGFALMEVAKEKEGLSYLRRYVKEYPEHENVPNAYRILADVEFDANRFKVAEELYQQILKFPASPIIGYALYKIGWCNYNMKNNAKAMMGLEQAILWTRTLENTDHLLSLKREAGRDLISIYAEIGNHKRAYEYFERFLGGGDAAKWLADLARELERNGLFEKSNELYAQLLTLNPAPEDRMQFQTAMIYGSYQLRDWKSVLALTGDLVNGFEIILKPEQPPESPAHKAEKILNEVVLAQHFEFDQYAAKEDIQRILAIDELYLRAFGNWKQSQMPLYQYAHFLMKKKKEREASLAFTKHWEQFRNALKEPLKEESIRNLVHALETVDQEKDSDPAATNKRVDEIVKYTAEYAQLYPKNKNTRPIGFLRTVTLLKHGRTEDGITESQKLFDEEFTDDFGGRTFKNLRVAYYGLKDWKRTYEWSSMMLKKPGMEKTPYMADLKTVREEALFLWADGTQDNQEAAKLYLQIAEDPAMLRLRPKALYNAFLQFKAADKRPEALAVAIRLEQASPQAQELAQISGVRAAYYQEAGDYEKALPLYEQFLRNPGKDTAAETLDQARLSAALISENLGKAELAAQLYNAVAAGKDAGAPLAADARIGLARLSESAKRQPASTAARAPFKKAETLVAMMQDLEKSPLAKSDDLAAKIQGGAAKLEKSIRLFLEASGDPGTPPYHAYELYCAVPFLYTYFQKGVRALGEGQAEELKVELEKIAGPLDPKSLEIADQCMARAVSAYHDGPIYRKVLGRWGWMRSPALVSQVDKIRGLLGSNAPWLDPAPIPQPEEEILKMHLEGKGTPDTWFALARNRMSAGKMGLAKLTLLNALSKTPDSGRILNLLAVIKQMDRAEPVVLDASFSKAGSAGSGLAFANLALIHLNGARYEQAMTALEQAKDGGAFENKPDIRSAIGDAEDLHDSLPPIDAPQSGGSQ